MVTPSRIPAAPNQPTLGEQFAQSYRASCTSATASEASTIIETCIGKINAIMAEMDLKGDATFPTWVRYKPVHRNSKPDVVVRRVQEWLTGQGLKSVSISYHAEDIDDEPRYEVTIRAPQA